MNQDKHNTGISRSLSYQTIDEAGINTAPHELDSLLHENKTHAMTQPRQHGPWQQSPC